MVLRSFLVLLIFVTACRPSTPDLPTTISYTENQVHLSPEDRYGDLFRTVQLAEVFPDSKTFPDCTPKITTTELLEKYATQSTHPDFDIAAFVKNNFDFPQKDARPFKADTSLSLVEHINKLWPILTRQPQEADKSTRLPLPKPYVVSSSRSSDLFYQESYFTILGLQAAGKFELIENMADNFATLIDREGYIPAGSRTYFLGRSQAPFFSLIVKILAEEKGDKIYLQYLPQLKKEYEFWMEGLTGLSHSQPSHRRLVRLEDGSVLNRYWDDRPLPRPEAYREDIALAEGVNIAAPDLYRHIRAACESGWNFSSRWFKDGQYLASIHTTDLIPVDLNSLLYHLESVLAKAYQLDDDEEEASISRQKAQQRYDAMQRYCWDEKQQFFVDYDHIQHSASPQLSLAGMYPLFVGWSGQVQADSVAVKIANDFLQAGGVLSSLAETGQKWDAPNSQASLQWITIQGLRNYGANELADTIKGRWIELNTMQYKKTGKLMEKYNVVDLGEEVADGTDWTSGVLLKLLLEEKEE